MNSMQKLPDPSARLETGKVLERLFELSVRLGDGMQSGLDELGLTRARAELIWRLGESGPMTHHALSQQLQCTPRNVTGLVDALQEAGFVDRRPHPNDRRASLVDLTDHGRAGLTRMQAGYQELAHRLFADLDAGDLACFAVVLERVSGRLAGSQPS